MMQGQIDADNQAVISLQVRSPNNPFREFFVVIDTGFSGYLTLPIADILALQLPFQQRQTYTLGDGNDVEFDIYFAVVLWHGMERDIFVLAAGEEPLLGMKMLNGSHVFLDVIDGGEIRITLRPPSSP